MFHFPCIWNLCRGCVFQAWILLCCFVLTMVASRRVAWVRYWSEEEWAARLGRPAWKTSSQRMSRLLSEDGHWVGWWCWATSVLQSSPPSVSGPFVQFSIWLEWARNLWWTGSVNGAAGLGGPAWTSSQRMGSHVGLPPLCHPLTSNICVDFLEESLLHGWDLWMPTGHQHQCIGVWMGVCLVHLCLDGHCLDNDVEDGNGQWCRTTNPKRSQCLAPNISRTVFKMARVVRISPLHSWKKCFCLREPVFWGSTFRILTLNFPNFEA